MYLSRLELHGFKSFADATTVDFSPGVTVVVGPNGCGKSNIVDAVRWVIGEQRARILRSEKMDNVIFNGTSNRKALGMSEVLLTIENTRGILPIEFQDVTIGRRLFRSGESEYLLNGVQCRLKDITDLFMDTGMGAGAYSVIELKMIEDILSENAQDRRHMFEEAAGISKYKIRRNQTLRKLAGTQGDLNRVRDLVEELDTRVSSLQRQAKKAARFKSLDERLNHLILSLAVSDYEQLSSEDTVVESRLQDLGDLLTAASAELTAEEAAHEALRKDHVEKEQALVTAQTALSDHLDMLRSAETDLRLNQERRESIGRDLARSATEKERAEVRATALAALLDETRTSLENERPNVDEAESRLAEVRNRRDAVEQELARQREKRTALVASERKVLEDLNDRKARVERLSSKVEHLDGELSDGQATRREIDERLETLEAQIEETVAQLEASKGRLTESSDRLSNAQEEHAEQETLLDSAEQSLHAQERRLDAIDAEIGILENILSSYEDFSDSVRFLAESPDWSSDPVRTVADLLSCDDDVRLALDQALGSYASCLVVADANEASRAISRLQGEEKGRATFIVLDRLKAPGKIGRPDIPVDAVSMTQIVKAATPAGVRLVDVLLGSCYLVDELAAVEKTGASGRFFTPAGDWYDGLGIRHGGGRSDPTPTANRIERRDQLENAVRERDQTAGRVDDLQKAADEARTQLDGIPLGRLESDVQEARDAVVEAEKQLSRLTYEREITRRRRDEVASRHDQLSASRKTAAETADNLEQGLEDLAARAEEVARHIRELEAEHVKDEADGRAIAEAFNEANVTAVQARYRVENLVATERRTLSDQRTLEKESAERTERMTLLQQELDASESAAEALNREIEDLRQQRSDLDRAVGHAKEALMEVKVSISDLEARLRELRRDREQKLSEESLLSVRRAEIRTRLDDLIQTMDEDFELNLREFEYEIDDDFEAAPARREISELRSRIRNMGPINALALESFESEKERLEFLQKQLADLEHAEITLKTTIDEINETASRRFRTTFDAIQDNFSTLFTDLFGSDASAELVLEDPDDPLESTIEIFAKPSGKRPSVLAQLSGGEKTLTAIALLFSIYLVKPSPFCILDEVDAPLDDANIDRFMHLIRTFSESTQFVLVTHNKRTMEAADRMYGITMQEQGISKLVGVKFDERERELPLVA